MLGLQVSTAEPSETMRVKPIFVARGDRTYVLTGGLGGFGLALAVWLSQRGARHFVLSSKRCALPISQPAHVLWLLLHTPHPTCKHVLGH